MLLSSRICPVSVSYTHLDVYKRQVLDYLFIAVFHMGISGAALATVLSYCVGGIIPFFYFLIQPKDRLRLTKTKLYARQLLDVYKRQS